MALPSSRVQFKNYCLRADEHWEPRFYYILINNTSGKKYFGQTRRCLKKYLGSGIYWKNHCKSHGGYNRKNISVLFTVFLNTRDEAEKFIEDFEKNNPNYWSEDNKIWANLCKENTENNPFYSNEITIRGNKRKLENGTHPFLRNNQSEKIKANHTNTELFKQKMINKYGVDNALKIPEVARKVRKKTKETKASVEWKLTKEPDRIKKYNTSMDSVDSDGITKRQKRNKNIGITNKAIIDEKVKNGNYHLLNGFYAVLETGEVQWVSSDEYRLRKLKGCTMYSHPTSKEGKRRKMINGPTHK
jgi:hypothetical protein